MIAVDVRGQGFSKDTEILELRATRRRHRPRRATACVWAHLYLESALTVGNHMEHHAGFKRRQLQRPRCGELVAAAEVQHFAERIHRAPGIDHARNIALMTLNVHKYGRLSR